MPIPPATRLYCPEPLAPGATVTLSGGQAHRLQHVLRLAVGARVAAFNERDGEWICRIDRLSRGSGELSAVAQRRPPGAGPDVWLLFAPIKRARLDWLVEKATELGVAALGPVVTERTQPERINIERLRMVAASAAEQSERLSVPDIRAATTLSRLLAEWPHARRLLLCDESGGGAPIATALHEMVTTAPVALLIGPEGGFAETELDALGKLPIVTRVGLGPRILRAETAALAVLAVYQAIAGDWRQAGRDACGRR